MKLGNCHHYVELLLNDYLKEGMICIDATCGNGHDTIKLAKVVGANGHVYGFDIQSTAIDHTSDLINQHKLSNVTLFLDSHDLFEKHISESVDLILYNLGYLPGGDKSITTSKDSTILSIQSGIELLNSGGLLIAIVYTGHPSGKEEGDALDEFVATLSQKTVEVSKISFLNQKNSPPHALIISKK